MRCNFDVAIGEKMLNIFKKEHKYETKSQKRNGVITFVCWFFSQPPSLELFRPVFLVSVRSSQYIDKMNIFGF